MRILLIGVMLAAVSAAHGATLDTETLSDASKVRGAFLSVGTAARPVGMGEAFTAVADDASAASWNPGGLGQVTGPAGMAQYNAAGPDLSLSHVAGAMPLGPGVAGLGITLVQLGEYDERDANGVKTGTKSLMDMAFLGSYAIANPGWLGGKGWTGGSLEVVNESVAGAMFAASLGGLYPLMPGLRAGWAVQHLGPAVDGFSLPAVAQAGAAYELSEVMQAALDAGYGLIDKQFFVAVGTEVAAHKMLALRVGYKYAGDQGVEGLTGVTAGLGVRVGSFGLDYAYQPFGDLAVSHRVALVYGGPKPAAL